MLQKGQAMPDYSSEWITSDSGSRTPFDRPRKSETEHCQFRCYLPHVRVVDEIVQSASLPQYKTRSDFFSDATALLLEHVAEHFSDGVTGRSLRLLQMENIENEWRSRERYLKQLDEQIDVASETRDREYLNFLSRSSIEEKGENIGHAPQSYIDELQRRIDRLARLFDTVN